MSKRPNVLIIYPDQMRYDIMGCAGNEVVQTPAIDKLAADGVRFSKHMSQSSWTKCSMASLWTGLYPIRTGVLRGPQALSTDARMPVHSTL